MENLFQTSRERRIAIVVFALVILVLVGSSISIANFNAIQQAVNGDATQEDLETASVKLQSSYTFSILTLLISIGAVLTPVGMLIYRKVRTNKVVT